MDRSIEVDGSVLLAALWKPRSILWNPNAPVCYSRFVCLQFFCDFYHDEFIFLPVLIIAPDRHGTSCHRAVQHPYLHRCGFVCFRMPFEIDTIAIGVHCCAFSFWNIYVTYYKSSFLFIPSFLWKICASFLFRFPARTTCIFCMLGHIARSNLHVPLNSSIIHHAFYNIKCSVLHINLEFNTAQRYQCFSLCLAAICTQLGHVFDRCPPPLYSFNFLLFVCTYGVRHAE